MSALLAIAAAFTIVAASPGPANLACAGVAMAHGRAAALRFAVGLTIGLALWGVLAALGLGALLVTFEAGLIALKILGAAYLFWLAATSARSALRRETAKSAPRATRRWVWRGLVLNLSNPKAVVAWMAVLAVGLDPAAPYGALLTALIVCWAIGLANYLMWALAFSTGRAHSVYAKARRGIEAALAVAFAAAGLGLLRSALTKAT